MSDAASTGAAGLHAKQPSGPIGILIEQFGLAGQRAIAGDDLAGHRTVDIGCRLDGFDHGAGLARAHGAADVRNLDEHQIAERALRVIGNADLDRAVLPAGAPTRGSWCIANRSVCCSHVNSP